MFRPEGSSGQFRPGLDAQVRNDEEFRAEGTVFQQGHHVLAFVGGDGKPDVRFIIFGEGFGLYLLFDRHLDDGFDFQQAGDDGGGFLRIVFRHGGGKVLLMHTAFVTGVYCTSVINSNMIGIRLSMKKYAACAA